MARLTEKEQQDLAGFLFHHPDLNTAEALLADALALEERANRPGVSAGVRDTARAWAERRLYFAALLERRAA